MMLAVADPFILLLRRIRRRLFKLLKIALCYREIRREE